MVEPAVARPAGWRLVAVPLAVALGLVLVAGMVLALLPSTQEAMPDTIWLRGTTPTWKMGLGPGDVRIERPDGLLFADAVLISAWGVEGGSPHEQGVAFRRPLEGVGALRWRLARLGVWPQATVHGAGYEATGRTAEQGGETWREFALFDEDYTTMTTGWWPGL